MIKLKLPLPAFRLGLCAVGVGLIALLPFLQPGDGTAVPRDLLFLGRFHPMVLHMPIGLILLALLLEAGRWPVLRRALPAAPRPVIQFVVGLGAASALMAALLGWMLSYSGGYDPKVLKLHMIAGLVTAGGATVTYGLLLLTAARPQSRFLRMGAKWWVQSGASPDAKVGALKVPDDVKLVLERQVPDSEKEALELARRQQAEQLDASLASLRQSVPGSLRLIVPGQSDLEFTVGNRAGEFGDPQLQQLAPIASNLRWIDLRRAHVSGAGLKSLAQMSNVSRLELQETARTTRRSGRLAAFPDWKSSSCTGRESPTRASRASLRSRSFASSTCGERR